MKLRNRGARPDTPHAHEGWPDGRCAQRFAKRTGVEICRQPRTAPIHFSYPCPVCGDVRWSIEARLIHIEQAHTLLRKAWERA